jgi:hypothetical protein
MNIDEDGKLSKDLDDLLGGETLWRDTYHSPPYLESSVKPYSSLLEDVQTLLRGEGEKEGALEKYIPNVGLSVDPGDFMCGFIYYAGLVERWKVGEERKVLFLHVRSGIEEGTVNEGREVALAVVRAALALIEG